MQIDIEVFNSCPKCKYPISAPLQSLLSQDKEIICRDCGYTLKIKIENDIPKLDAIKQDYSHACLSICKHFRYGVCTNENAKIQHEIKKNPLSKKIEKVQDPDKSINFYGKNIKLLPEEGCSDIKR